ncbi:hypothetical protein HY256_06430 [Candidatus Sumerlaeota bacterium]|nr:hypothetical protein [Candidatus Sumerlaeota bacterium]
MLEKKIHVRKKADLVRGATGMEEKPAPDGKKEYTLTGEITNQGETEAFNVMVVFYRSAVKTAENEVGRVVLPVVKPGEKAVARLALTPEMRKFLAAGGSAPQPSHGFALNWLRRNVPAPQPAPAPAARK